MRKNKGIIIELTALLDVIFIMLFWVMINVQENGTKAKEDADSRVAKAQAEVVQVRQETESALESMRAQTDSEIKKAKEHAEKLDKNAAANQQALDDYGSGMMLTIDLRYAPGSELTIFRGDEELGRTAVTSQDDVRETLGKALEKAGIGKEDVVLCAFVYDGSRALYRDVSEITEAVGSLGERYENFYCTYINTAR